MYGDVPPEVLTVPVPFGAGVEVIADVIAAGGVMVTVCVTVLLAASVTVTV